MLRSSSLAVSILGIIALSAAGQPREGSIRAEIAKVQGDVVILVQRGDGGDRTHTVKVNDRTQILVPGEKVRVVGEDGTVVERTTARDGKLADLKTGQRVFVTIAAVAADGIAAHIVVAGSPAPREVRRDGDAPREGVAPREGDAPREGPARPQVRRQVHSGWVARRNGNNLVLKMRGEGREIEREVLLPERIRVSVQTKDVEEVMGDGGRRITRQKIRSGGLENLAVGKYVVVRQFGPESAQVTVLLGDGREGGDRGVPAGKEFAGKLTQIDANAIVVEGKGPDGKQVEVFAIDDATQVLVGERRGQLTDLHAGMEVVVTWTEANKAARVVVRGK